MIGSLPGAGPDQRMMVCHGHRIDLTRHDDGLWTAVLHRAPHRPLCPPGPLDVVVWRLAQWTRADLERRAAGVRP